MKRSIFIVTLFVLICCQSIFAQNQVSTNTPVNIRDLVGERLTYNISYANFPSAAYAETYVVSQGKYGVNDAIYLEGKLRTNEIVSAAFFQIDEYRKTLVDADTGLPIFYKSILGENGISRESVTDLKGNATSFDCLGAVFQLRLSNSFNGTLALQEGGKNYTATYTQVGKAHNKTSAGEYDTNVYEIIVPGYPPLQVFLSDDNKRIPVAFSFKAGRGMVHGELASIQNAAPDSTEDIGPKPKPTPTPVVANTPKPRPTPVPYSNNEPLSSDLPFQLGETLTYRLSKTANTPSFGSLAVTAKERRQFFGPDSVLLTAEFKDVSDSASPFKSGDIVKSYVDPEALLPQRTEISFKGTLSQSNQTLVFNQPLGKVTDSRGTLIDIPVGTHDILSLAYAIRSFNLKDVKAAKGPSDDIRVALVYGDTPVILTILSQPEEMVDYQGQKVTAQIVFATIGTTTAKMWISKNPDRLPLRLSLSGGAFTFVADLVSVVQNPPPIEVTNSAVNRVTPVNRPLPVSTSPAPATNTPASTPGSVPGFPGVVFQPGNTPMDNPTLINPLPAEPNPTTINPALGPDPTQVNPVPSPANPTLVNPKPRTNIKVKP